MAASWTYLLADLRTNVITAEIPLEGARPSLKLGAAGTMSGTWNLSTSWNGGDPYGLTRPGRTVLYALRDDRPIYGGILWTSRYDSTTQKIELGSADWWSYLDHRKVLPLLPPAPTVTDVAALSVAYTQQDQNDIARSLVQLAAAHTGGDIGLTYDTTTSGVLRDHTYFGYELADIGQAIKQLSEVEGGPDIAFGVGANLDSDGRPIRLMRVGNPLIGQAGADWVFETGANILAYNFGSDATRMATRTYAKGEGSELGSLIAVAESTYSYDDGWAALEHDQSYTNVTETGTLQDHATADQYAARLPVVSPTFVVAGDGRDRYGNHVYPEIGSYGVGDQARIVLQDIFFSAGLDFPARIIGIDIDPGDDGVETVTLTVAPIVDNVA